MGIDIFAQLNFGIVIGELSDFPASMQESLCDNGDLDAYFAKSMGVKDVAEDANIDAYWDEVFAAIKNCPVDMCVSGNGDDPWYILFVRGAEDWVSQDSTQAIDLAKMVVDEDAIEGFNFWLLKHGIEPQEPKWILSTYMSY